MKRFAKLHDDGDITIVDGHPTSIDNPDGSTTSAAPDTEPDFKFLAERGWYPLVDDVPKFDSTTHEIVDKGFSVQDDKIVHAFAVQPLPPASQDLSKDAEDRLNARIDGIMQLFTDIQERLDAAIGAAEGAAAIVANVSDLVDELRTYQAAMAQLRSDVAALQRKR